jgi:hypothetical protein
MPDQVKPLSDAIIEPITKAYRVGGFGLAFLLLGAVMILLGALISVKDFTYPLAFVGLLLVVIPCYFFYIKEIRPISMARKSTAQNREMIDAVQATAIEVTKLTLVLQALAFKHGEQIVEVLKVTRPQIRRIPRVGATIDTRLLGKTDELAKAIVTATGTIQEVVVNIQEALTYSDAKRLHQYLRDIERMEARVKAVLASPEFETSKEIHLDST